MEFIVTHKKMLTAIVVVLVAAIGVLGIVKLNNNIPVNLKKTDLSKASQSTINKAADQLSIDITGLPDDVDEQTKDYLDNQLAYLLRQKYGAKSTDYTATVRTVAGYDGYGGVSVYVDVPEANETYLGSINIKNHLGSFSCAPQDQQMSPDSRCEELVVPDTNNFPNG